MNISYTCFKGVKMTGANNPAVLRVQVLFPNAAFYTA